LVTALARLSTLRARRADIPGRDAMPQYTR
jgi:hypothetical protein